MSKTLVLVTGAGGYLASHIISHLVQKNKYEIRGTVRSLEKSQHIQKLFPQVKLYEADLLKEHSFDEALKNVEIVFHAASPFQLENITDPLKQLIEPAVQGTLNVLKAVDRAPSVRRVILTSSVAAVAARGGGGGGDKKIYSEKDWNLESSVTKDPYPYSKRLAEEAAWNYANGKKWKLTSINPSLIMGEPLSDRVDGVSVTFVKNLLEGKHVERFPANAGGSISVHDVAEAHILAAEKKEAIGQRYLVTLSPGVTFEEYNNFLVKSGQFSAFPLHKNQFKPVKNRFLFDNSKVQKELGLVLTPLDITIVNMAKSLIDLKIVKIPAKL